MTIPYWKILLGPYILYGIGLALNALAVAAGHGQMMVLWPGGCGTGFGGDDPIHGCMTAATHFKIISDWIYLPRMGMASIGDVFLITSNYLQNFCLYVWIALVIKDYND